MVDTDDGRPEGLADLVACPDEQGHVLLQVLVCAGQNARDCVHDDHDRQLAQLLAEGRDGAQQLVHIRVEHEIDRLPDQVEGGLVGLHVEIVLPRPETELDVAHTLGGDIDHRALALDRAPPPVVEAVGKGQGHPEGDE